MGLIIAVWVGINIYNVVDRIQIDKLISKQKVLKDNIKSLTNEIERLSAEKNDLQIKYEELKTSIDATCSNIELVEKKVEEVRSLALMGL